MRCWLLLLLATPFVTNAQNSIRDYVEQKALPIRTISSDSTDFSDLEGIGNAIGESRIVMLGEQDHGDGSTFMAKTRLIKYLHERKGFNVLVFEGDFFTLNEGFAQASLSKDSLRSFIWHSIYPIWTACRACRDLLYNYLPAHATGDTALTLSGMDSQMFFSYDLHHLHYGLDSMLRHLDLPLTRSAGYSSRFLALIDSSTRMGWWYRPPGEMTMDSLVSQLTEARREAGLVLSKDDFWIQVLDNLLSETKEIRGLQKHSNGLASNARDPQMAQNLAWLARVKYPGQKLIVWAANAHVQKLMNGYTMGGILTTDSTLKAQTYVIGFTGYEGIGGRIGSKPYTVPPPSRESFEGWIDPSLPFAFVDFRGFHAQYARENPRFEMRGGGFHSSKNYWTQIYDGMFFIREAKRCEFVVMDSLKQNDKTSAAPSQ